MNVENIRLINFRNYENISLEFNKDINIFIGKNGEGKTNLMEAIYMCAMGRSFRTNRDRESINFNKNEAYIGANVNLGNYKRFVEVKLSRSQPKRIRVNKTELDSFKDLFSGLNVVYFTPDDLRIVKDGPRERRNLIDSGVYQLKPLYNYNLNKYGKILYQRNNLLKSSRFKSNIDKLLDIFDVQIAEIGTKLVLERYEYISKLNKIAKRIHREVSDGEDLNLKYVSNIPILNNREKMEKEYLRLLKTNLKKDLENGVTEFGPHRDDILMSINDFDARIYGSQGQQRTIVLSIILSEVQLIRNVKGIYPILLLDDVFSELDRDRRKYLSGFLKEIQTFITATNSEDLRQLKEFNKDVFFIENGNFRMREGHDDLYRQ